MKIGLCGNISLDYLASCLDKTIPQSDIIVGKPGGFLNEIANPQGDFTGLDICIIVLFWRDIAPLAHNHTYGDDVEIAFMEFGAACDSIISAIKKFRAKSPAKVFLFSPDADYRNEAGFINRLLEPSPFALIAGCQARFNTLCRSVIDVYPVDIAEITHRLGSNNAFDPAAGYRENRPFSCAMTTALAHHIAAMCVQFQKYPLKCLVLDCDNTLWGGIVGEVGAENLILGDKGIGKAFKDFQAEIVKLHKQGVILALCSKNNTCDVLNVLEKHPHMLLRPSMISSFRINWEDKPKSLIGISEELNIGLDAMMFVDDSYSERDMVRATLPEVEVLELPSDPAFYADALKKNTRFWPLQLTKDDASKGVFYASEQKRKQAQELTANIENYLAQSKISVFFADAAPETISRITQLFNKTNQFNLTTKRYSQNELESLARKPGNRLFYMSMADRFGDYGIIGSSLCIGNVIDSFLLSCRAFGKRAETAFLIFLLKTLKNSGHKQALGRFSLTPKNNMVKDFYKNAGFEPEKQGGNEVVWRFDLTRPMPDIPRWITVTNLG
jgi:FkbH-like protein